VTPGQVSYMPSEGMASNREKFGRTIAAACHVPWELIKAENGAGVREAQRSFSVRLQQRAEMLAEVMREKLATDVQLDASKVFQADIALRARAFRQLIDAGLEQAEARAVVGL